MMVAMARWRPKGDPTRVTNWLATLRHKSGDTLRLVRVSGMGSVGVSVVATYSGTQLSDGPGTDVFAQQLIDLAQGSCDELGSRQEYRLELLREGSDVPEVQFELRCEPQDGDNFDDEDPSPQGQVRQQMTFTRQLMHMSTKAPLAAIESLTLQLGMAHERIRTLENERAAFMDTYAEALTLIAEAQAHKEPSPTLVQQVGEVTSIAPGVINLFKMFLKPTPANANAPAQTGTGIVKV